MDAPKNKDIVFVEVKTRTSQKFGFAEYSINKAKKQKIKQTINQFLLEKHEFKDYFPSFDVLIIEIKKSTNSNL